MRHAKKRNTQYANGKSHGLRSASEAMLALPMLARRLAPPCAASLRCGRAGSSRAAARLASEGELLTTEEMEAIKLRDGSGGATNGPLVQVRASRQRGRAPSHPPSARASGIPATSRAPRSS